LSQTLITYSNTYNISTPLKPKRKTEETGQDNLHRLADNTQSLGGS